jgi:hypothetical protein
VFGPLLAFVIWGACARLPLASRQLMWSFEGCSVYGTYICIWAFALCEQAASYVRAAACLQLVSCAYKVPCDLRLFAFREILVYRQYFKLVASMWPVGLKCLLDFGWPPAFRGMLLFGRLSAFGECKRFPCRLRALAAAYSWQQLLLGGCSWHLGDCQKIFANTCFRVVD